MDQGLFCFFISGEATAVFPGDGLWEMPLSGGKNRVFRNFSSDQTVRDSKITIGDYFLAAAEFLSKRNFSILKSGLAAVLNIRVQTDQICKIMVFLEKHGAFYHPLKIQVHLNEPYTGLFVLNGAVSKPGLSLIETEYQLISSLNKTHSKRYLPNVFGIDFIKIDKGEIGFFLGEWFEGYKEFHATEGRGKQQIVVWESDGSRHFLSEASACPIYRKIARILTYYYDIETFDQIFPWHHAAGDFVVRQEGNTSHVRLVTARGFRPLTPFNDGDQKVYILPSLMFFCLNLTIRMRLDRLDGTGQAVLLGEKILPAVVEGFLQALDEKSQACDLGNIRASFITFFQQFTAEQMMKIMENILESWPLETSEALIIQENIESHSKFLHLIFKRI